jgi:hypothetical protein
MDTDDIMTRTLDTMEGFMRNQLADAVEELLGEVADGLDGDEDADDVFNSGIDFSGVFGDDDADGSETLVEDLEPDAVNDALKAAFTAGWAACVERFREDLDAATWSGYRPQRPDVAVPAASPVA